MINIVFYKNRLLGPPDHVLRISGRPFLSIPIIVAEGFVFKVGGRGHDPLHQKRMYKGALQVCKMKERPKPILKTSQHTRIILKRARKYCHRKSEAYCIGFRQTFAAIGISKRLQNLRRICLTSLVTESFQKIRVNVAECRSREM